MDLLETKFATQCTIRMKWKVKEEALKEALEKGKALCSSSFKASHIPGVNYYLCLKMDIENPTEVNIFFHLNFEMAKKISATFIISVKSAPFNTKLEYTYDRSYGWGSKLCTRDELFNPEKKFFVNGIMEVELEATLKLQGIKRKAAQSLSVTLWEDEDDRDFTIVIDKKELKVHKLILCAASSVFKTELKPVGKRPMRKKFNITDFDYETVKLAVEVCYERDIKDRITVENASQLLQFADEYNIDITVQNVLVEKLSEDNVVKFANISIKSKAVELQEYCICFLMKFVGKNTVINDIKKLNSNITDEIARRSIFSTSE